MSQDQWKAFVKEVQNETGLHYHGALTEASKRWEQHKTTLQRHEEPQKTNTGVPPMNPIPKSSKPEVAISKKETKKAPPKKGRTSNKKKQEMEMERIRLENENLKLKAKLKKKGKKKESSDEESSGSD